MRFVRSSEIFFWASVSRWWLRRCSSPAKISYYKTFWRQKHSFRINGYGGGAAKIVYNFKFPVHMEYFEVGKVKHEGDESKNPFAFKYYNPEEVVMEKMQIPYIRTKSMLCGRMIG